MDEKTTSAYIKDLVKNECINFKHGNCLMESEPCKIVHPDHKQNQNDDISCEYLVDCAIPADWDEDDLRAYALWRSENIE